MTIVTMFDRNLWLMYDHTIAADFFDEKPRYNVINVNITEPLDGSITRYNPIGLNCSISGRLLIQQYVCSSTILKWTIDGAVMHTLEERTVLFDVYLSGVYLNFPGKDVHLP